MACTLWPIVGKHDIRKVIIISTTKWKKVKHEKGKKKQPERTVRKVEVLQCHQRGTKAWLQATCTVYLVRLGCVVPVAQLVVKAGF